MCDRPSQAIISETVHVKHGVIRAYEIGEARSAEMIKCRRPLILLEFSEIEERIPLHNCIAASVDEGIALMGAVGVAQETTTTGAAQDDDVADGGGKTHCRRRSESFSVTDACNVGNYSRHPGGYESGEKWNRIAGSP